MNTNKAQLEIKSTAKTDEHLEDVLNQKLNESNTDSFFSRARNLMALYKDGYFERVSTSLEKLLGYNQEELTTAPVREFTIKDPSGQIPDISSVQNKENFSYYFENIYYCKDGSIKWIRWRLIPDLSDECLFITGWDITSERRVMILNSILTV